MVIVPADGLKLAKLPTVKAPFTVKSDEVVTVAELAMVKPLKARVPELAIDEPLFIVIVPADGVKLANVSTVKTPFTVKLAELVTVAELARVKLLKVSVPLLAILAPLFIVIVPAEGVKVPLTVNAPPTVAVLVPVVIVPEIVKLL